ncbi:MAG: MarR family transcriptional regulator [Gemmatimonadetes bacterium]|nr:MarR family transcriptional regulator [Gemmatimonadota bacterium]
MTTPSTLHAPSAGPRTSRAGLGEDVDAALHLWVVLTRAYAAVNAVAREDIRSHGLTEGEFSVLELLFHKGPVLLGEIQRRVLVSSGGITFLVDRLADKGLVERRDCPSDRRARFAVLTSAGEDLLARIFPLHAARMAEAVAGLSREEQAQATALLRRLGYAAAAVSGGAK